MIKGGSSDEEAGHAKSKRNFKIEYEMGLSLREIGKACSCGKTTVSEVL